MIIEAMAARAILIQRLAVHMAAQWAKDPQLLAEIASGGFKGFSKMDNASILEAARAAGVRIDDVDQAMQHTASPRG